VGSQRAFAVAARDIRASTVLAMCSINHGTKCRSCETYLFSNCSNSIHPASVFRTVQPNSNHKLTQPNRQQIGQPPVPPSPIKSNNGQKAGEGEREESEGDACESSLNVLGPHPEPTERSSRTNQLPACQRHGGVGRSRGSPGGRMRTLSVVLIGIVIVVASG
jgi:hypothetical protein